MNGGMMADNFTTYMLTQSRKREAYERLNYAQTAYEKASIEDRLAELQSQAEPMATIINKKISESEKIIAAAHYVVTGRLPDEK